MVYPSAQVVAESDMERYHRAEQDKITVALYVYNCKMHLQSGILKIEL
jgi:hypothetical protein